MGQTNVCFVIVAVALDVKRKEVGEQQNEMNISTIDQTQQVDYDEEENDPNRRCVDLIVLGISYRSLEADVKKCFESFGELIFCEVIDQHESIEELDQIISLPDQTRSKWTITWFWFYSI